MNVFIPYASIRLWIHNQIMISFEFYFDIAD